MICIGFITQQQTKPKKHFFRGYTKEVFLSEKNPFALVAVTIPCMAEDIPKIKEKKLGKLVQKAQGLLEEAGAKKIVFSRTLRPFAGKIVDSDWLEAAKKEVFLRTAEDCVRRFAPECGINLLAAKVCIRDSEMGRISENLMRRLCFDVKNLTLCTPKTEYARELCDSFCDEMGMYVSVTSAISENAADVLVDVDGAYVKFGRALVVDGVEPDFDTGGYDVETVDFAACLDGQVGSERILSYLSGKKKLTL